MNKLLLALTLIFPAFSLAVDITPLNIKEGLWEVTMTRSGGLEMPKLPPGFLEKVTPERRAQLESVLGVKKGELKPIKECITKEKLAKHKAFNTKNSKCKHTVVSSTANRFEANFHCDARTGGSDGTLLVQAIDSETVNGSMSSHSKKKGKDFDMKMSFNSKYLGPNCGKVK